jgi:flavin-dependent dehydrogenase
MAAQAYDLMVVGGGPAGCAAAISAARHGARVLVLERGRFPRHKVCGEFVSAESLRLLKSLLTAGQAALLAEAAQISQARFFLDGHVLQTSIAPSASSIARFDLDFSLWRSAEQSGVDTLQQTPVQEIQGEGPFRAVTPAGEFEARALVNASGRWSNLSQAGASNGKPRKKWLGLKAHFAQQGAGPSAEPSVDLYFFAGGYCGVQPVEVCGEQATGGRINACAMVCAEVASTLPEVFAQNPALLERSRHWQPVSEPVSTSPLIFRQPQALLGNVFLAGDAAGFVDPFAGDGISLALRSGALAAAFLAPFLQGRFSLSEAAHRYRQSYEQQFASVFRSASKIRQALLLPRVVRKPILLFLERTPAVTRYLVKKTR